MCLAVPGKILSIEGDDPMLRTARVDFAGIVKPANLAYVPEARVGDYVLVHVGFALHTVDEAEAALTFEYLRQMGELADLEDGRTAGDAAPGPDAAAPPPSPSHTAADDPPTPRS